VKFRDRIAKLIDVKTIVTFALTGAFVYLSVCEKIEPQIFMTIYTMVIGFYFGSNVERHKGGQ
jgi:dihydroxyacid dehydratase/phosphogluconate dehydratase